MTTYYQRDGVAIYHGDALELVASLPVPDLVLTDPPYNVGVAYGSLAADHRADYAAWSRAWFAAVPRPLVFTPGPTHLAMWFAIQPPTWVGAWHKANAASASGVGGFSAWEPVLFYGRPPRRVPHDAWSVPITMQPWGPPHGSRPAGTWKLGAKKGAASSATPPAGYHPCPKPLGFWSRLLEATTHPGQLVLDPFLGSGTTLHAALLLGRRAIGVELEEAYCELAAARLEAVTLEPAA